MRAIDKKVGEIKDSETLKMFSELRQVTGVDPGHYADFTAYQFLQQCVYPNGPGKTVRISRDCVAKFDRFGDFVLCRKAGSVGDSLHRLLSCLTESLDNHTGTSIYMLLNRTLIPTKKQAHTRYFHRE